MIECGGYEEQAICIYDFTVKNLQHDCLNFSTRHITKEGKQKYVIEDYINFGQQQQTPGSTPGGQPEETKGGSGRGPNLLVP